MRIQAQLGGQDRIIELPDGATPEQIDEVLNHASNQFGSPIPVAEQAPVQPEPAPKDFLQRVGDDLDKRAANIENIRIRQKLWQPYTDVAKPGEYRGQGLNDISGALQQLGQYAGAGYDILGEGALSLYNAIPESVKDNAVTRTVGEAYKSKFLPGEISPADVVNTVGQTVGAGYEAAQQYAPDTVANLEAIAAIAPVTQAAGKAVTRGVGKLATPARVMPNSEQLAGMGVKGYEAARASGEVFDAPSVTNKFIAAIDSAKPKMIADAVETDLSQALESGLGKYRKLVDKPLGIDEIDIIDKDISNLKDKAFRAGENQLGSELSNIQNTLRQSVAESPSGQTLAQARDLYRRKYQMEDVERIFRNAEGRPNEATIIQTGFRNLSNQARKKGSGYTKEQIALMDKAAKGGLTINALKLMSSKLIPVIAGASGNLVGAGAAYVGNLAAGAGATALQTAKANKLAKSITKGITVEAEPTRINRLAQRLTKQDLQAAFEAKKGNNTPEQMLALPAPQTTVFVDKNGVAVPLTQADREIIGSGFGEPYSQENLYRGTRSENQTNRAGTTFLTPQKEYAAGYGNVENYKLNLGKSIDLTSYGETARIDDIYDALKDKFGRDTAEKLLNDSSVRANDTNIDVYSIFRSPENVKILKDKGIDFARFAQTSDNKPVESVVVFNPSKLKKGNK